MNAARATESTSAEDASAENVFAGDAFAEDVFAGDASAEEEPALPADGRAPVTDADVDAEHIRAVWEMAALTALDSIRPVPGRAAQEPVGGAEKSGPESVGGGERSVPERVGDGEPSAPAQPVRGPGPVSGAGVRTPDVSAPEPGDDPGPVSGVGEAACGPEAGERGFGASAPVAAGSGFAAGPSFRGPVSGGFGDGALGDALGAGGRTGPAAHDGQAAGAAFPVAADGGVRGGGVGLRDRFRTRDGGPDDGPPARRAPGRGGGDPVKGLLHLHRDLCEQAVDPFEIAAGLEAHGLTDRTAARFRHRDVFSLAEEMFARAEHTMPAAPTRASAPPARTAAPRAVRTALPLRAAAPGAVCALALAATAVTDGGQRFAAGAAGALATGLALLYALRWGPLRARGRRAPAATRLWTLWLLGYAACGQGLIAEIAGGGPEGRVPLTASPLLALAVAVVPATWCAHLFAVRAGRRIAYSRGLEEFAAGTRPLLLAVVALHTAVLTGLVLSAAAVLPGADGAAAPAVALGTLLFLARLLIAHGFPGPASAALATACAVEAAVPALLLTGRLPGVGLVARPAELLVAAWGTAAVPVLACAGAALALLVHACTVLVRASAHTP